VQQHKSALVKLTTSIPIEVIKNQFFSLGLMKHETELSEVTIGLYIGKVYSNVILAPINHHIIKLLWLTCMTYEWINTHEISTLKYHNVKH